MKKKIAGFIYLAGVFVVYIDETKFRRIPKQ